MSEPSFADSPAANTAQHGSATMAPAARPRLNRFMAFLVRGFSRQCLLSRNAGSLADRVPSGELVRHQLAERLGGGTLHDHAGRDQALAHSILFEDFVERRV